MTKIFLGDDLTEVGKRDRDRIHFGEPWERAVIKARKYRGKDTFDKRSHRIVLLFTRYGTFAVRWTYFKKHKDRILRSVRGYRTIVISKRGIKKGKTKIVITPKPKVTPKPKISFDIFKPVTPKPRLYKGMKPVEVAVRKRLQKRAKELGFEGLDIFSMDISSLIDSSLSIAENVKKIERELFGATEKDLMSLSYEFERKAQEEYQKYITDPEKWLEDLKYQEKKLSQMIGYL
jgi:hypothetical protein